MTQQNYSFLKKILPGVFASIMLLATGSAWGVATSKNLDNLKKESELVDPSKVDALLENIEKSLAENNSWKSLKTPPVVPVGQNVDLAAKANKSYVSAVRALKVVFKNIHDKVYVNADISDDMKDKIRELYVNTLKPHLSKINDVDERMFTAEYFEVPEPPSASDDEDAPPMQTIPAEQTPAEKYQRLS